MRIRLGIPLTLKEIANALGNPHFQIDGIIEYISTDSRDVRSGDLFIALEGDADSGNNYIENAHKSGAFTVGEGNVDIDVENGRMALGRIAGYYKTRLKNLLYTIGITGSVGKTTTKEFLKIILSAKYKVHSTYGNMNNNIGVPLTIMSAPENTEILIIEMGMNHKGEIRYLNSIANVDIAVITNIGSAHIGKLGSKENIANAKLEILEQGALPILPFEEELLNKAENAILFSATHTRAEYYIIMKGFESERICTIIGYRGNEYRRSLKISAPHLLPCIAASMAVAGAVRMDPELLVNQISLISDENTRQTVINFEKYTIIDDSYNASRESVIAAVNSFILLQPYQAKGILLGSIYELGKYSVQIHRELGRFIGSLGFSGIYLYGKYADELRIGVLDVGYSKESVFTVSSESSLDEMARIISDTVINNEVILMKGSRKNKLNEIIPILKVLERD